MKCLNCRKNMKDQTRQICAKCETRLNHNLIDLIQLHKEAHYCLQPQKGSNGTNSGEPTLGINLHALDFVAGNGILKTLHEWEKRIRKERQLTAPYLVPFSGSIEAEIKNSIEFHQTHLSWTIMQEWIIPYFFDIAQIHSVGTIAARRRLDPVKRIPCPADQETGEPCGSLIPVKGDDLLESVTCQKCRTQWTPARLIAVAMTDPRLEIWLDPEAIASWIGLSERHVRRLAKHEEVLQRGKLIELQSLIRIRNEIQ